MGKPAEKKCVTTLFLESGLKGIFQKRRLRKGAVEAAASGAGSAILDASRNSEHNQ